jgi:hypothetical protein
LEIRWKELFEASSDLESATTLETPLKDECELRAFAENLRRRLETEFRPDTAAPGFQPATPAAGQCAAVATIVNELLGGDLVSASVQGHSHWFNQIRVDDGTIEIDLTGDQFGLPPVQVARPWSLYPGARLRDFSELHAETIFRAAALAASAGLTAVENSLRESLHRKLRKSDVESR